MKKKKSGKMGGKKKALVGKRDMGKMPNWDGKKQGRSSKNKGFGPC